MKRVLASRLLPILLGIGFVLLVALSGMTVWLVDQADDDAAAVAQTIAVQGALSNVLLNVRRAETAHRGYFITAQDLYLAEYRAALPSIEQSIGGLLKMSAGNPGRRARAAQMEVLTSSKVEELGRAVALQQSGEREQAREQVLAGEGRDIMNRLRALSETGLAEESGLLEARRDASRRNSDRLLLLTLLGAALIVVIGAASIYIVRRSTRESEAARREVEMTNANLEQIVDARTADLTEANEEIQRFAYIVSHDLRSPLVNIMGFTSELEALRGDIFARVAELRGQLAALEAQNVAAAEAGVSIDDLGKDFDEALGFIKTSIVKMDRLINAVLKLSREGRRDFRPERLDMNELLSSIAQTVAHRAAEQGVTITIGDLPAVVSDRLALEQTFSNLVDNGLKYLRHDEPGRITIKGRTTPTHVVYDVIDNGRGIDPQDHQRVFELFRRAGPQDRPGEGIGLAHVRALVRRVGGSMGLESQIGKGSTFTVRLPRHWEGENRSAA